jgi:hypothetical protein
LLTLQYTKGFILRYRKNTKTTINNNKSILVQNHVPDLLGQPLDPFLQPLPGERVAGGNVPRLVHDLVEPQPRGDLDAAEGVLAVHLVREEQDGDLAVADIRMLQQQVELLLHHNQTQPVAAVHHEDDPVAVFVVVLPQVAVPAVPRHVERRERQVLVWNTRV